jgi:hypothetical protein
MATQNLPPPQGSKKPFAALFGSKKPVRAADAATAANAAPPPAAKSAHGHSLKAPASPAPRSAPPSESFTGTLQLKLNQLEERATPTTGLPLIRSAHKLSDGIFNTAFGLTQQGIFNDLPVPVFGITSKVVRKSPEFQAAINPPQNSVGAISSNVYKA